MPALSEREAQILTLMADEGMTAKEVALRVGTSYRTVELQVSNAVKKLGARNRLAAIIKWDRQRRVANDPSTPRTTRHSTR